MNGQVAVQSEIETKPMAPPGWTYIKRGDKLVLVRDVDIPKETTTAAQLLVSASVEDFLNTFHPLKAKEIEVGDRVWNRSSLRFGHVIRIVGSAYRVDTDGVVGTYWEQELEPR